MRLIRAKDYADVSRKAANIIAAQVHLKPDCVLGLATGSSPVGTYKELIAKYESGELDFSKVRTALIDVIANHPSEGEYALDLLMIAKYFERIGDHCTNIAEWVEFSVTGIHKDCQ